MAKFTGRFAEDMERRRAQPEPKPSKQAFYGRLCSWYTREQAMLTWEKWQKVMKKKASCSWPAKYIPTYSRFKKEEDIERYTWIDITYSKEEARPIRKEFVNVIEWLEWEIMQTEDKDCLKSLNDKLELAKAELDLFNSYNLKW